MQRESYMHFFYEVRFRGGAEIVSGGSLEEPRDMQGILP